jgi:methyl-accepting chemotaxis protein
MFSSEGENGLGKSGEIYLVGPDSLMRSESRFYKKSILHVPVKTESVRNAFNLHEGTQLNRDYRGTITLSSYSMLGIQDLRWVIIAEIDRREAMRPVYKLANEIVFLSIFIALILFVFAYIISRTITGPIIELKDATIRIGKGDFDTELNIKSNDELGELTENFNLMSSQLKMQQAELKEREIRMFTSLMDRRTSDNGFPVSCTMD